MNNVIAFSLYLSATLGCGARTELAAPTVSVAAVDPSRFVGLWNGSDEFLRTNHPYCARTPNQADGFGVRTQTTCTIQLTRDDASGDLLGILGGTLEIFRMNTADYVIYHRLQVYSETHAVFSNDVNMSDSGTGFHRISGTADLEGDTLVLRMCEVRRSLRDPPIELLQTQAHECRLRRIR